MPRQTCLRCQSSTWLVCHVARKSPVADLAQSSKEASRRPRWRSRASRPSVGRLTKAPVTLDTLVPNRRRNQSLTLSSARRESSSDARGRELAGWAGGPATSATARRLQSGGRSGLATWLFCGASVTRAGDANWAGWLEQRVSHREEALAAWCALPPLLAGKSERELFDVCINQ